MCDAELLVLCPLGGLERGELAVDDGRGGDELGVEGAAEDVLLRGVGGGLFLVGCVVVCVLAGEDAVALLARDELVQLEAKGFAEDGLCALEDLFERARVALERCESRVSGVAECEVRAG